MVLLPGAFPAPPARPKGRLEATLRRVEFNLHMARGDSLLNCGLERFKVHLRGRGGDVIGRDVLKRIKMDTVAAPRPVSNVNRALAATRGGNGRHVPLLNTKLNIRDFDGPKSKTR